MIYIKKKHMLLETVKILCFYLVRESVIFVFTAEYHLHFIGNNTEQICCKFWLQQWMWLPHFNKGPVRPNRWWKSKPETNGNAVRRKPEARCDSQIDSHRRCSAATYVRLWNVAPPSAGVLWALRHSPTMCLSTPQGRAGSPLPRASISLPGHRDDTATPQLQSLCLPRWPLTLSSSAMHRGHRVLSERGWRCRLLLTAQPEALLPQSQCTGRTKFWKISHLSYRRI